MSRASKLCVELQTIIVALLMAQVLPTAAQLPTAVQPPASMCATGMDRDAIFHVSVVGTPRPGYTSNRDGKAFAISPNVLVTSQHVLGDSNEWEMKQENSPEIKRAARLLNRRVELRRVRTSDNSLSDPISKSFVLPAASYAIDAAGLSVPGLNVEKHFCLSMCKIVKDGTYTAIMTSAKKPADVESLKALTDVPLQPADPDPESYGPLYVFDVNRADSSKFHGEPEGHDGSPILDRDGRVVALVSAVTVLNSDSIRILATPIGPLFPGTSELLSRELNSVDGVDVSLKCSLVDTVKRIHDQVATHATWYLFVEREKDGRPGVIRLRYESVSDKPNVKSIEVYYDYWGKSKIVDEQAEKIHGYSDIDEGRIVLVEEEKKERVFASDAISKLGKNVVEQHVKGKIRDGQIYSVRLRILPEFTNGKKATKPITLDFPWILLSAK